jgi:hypothetical protein
MLRAAGMMAAASASICPMKERWVKRELVGIQRQSLNFVQLLALPFDHYMKRIRLFFLIINASGFTASAQSKRKTAGGSGSGYNTYMEPAAAVSSRPYRQTRLMNAGLKERVHQR